MQPKHLDYLFEKVKRDAFKLEEIHGISAESLAEILKVLHRTKNQGSISKHTSAPTESTHKYTGPFPIGKFYSRGVPLRACRDSSKDSQFLQFNKGQKLILNEKNGLVARGYIQSDPLKKQGEINLQDVQFDLRFDDEYFSEVDAFASSLEESCAQSIKQLAEHLTRRYEDSIIFQLRSIYTWICYHISYDAEGFFGPPGARASNEARDVLKTRLAVCAGYANLFHGICEAVPLLAREVRVKVVDGYGRGYGSTIHMEKIPRTNFGYSNHAWNSVFIDGHPFFVESTWGAGILNGRAFIQKFNSSYFLSPPQNFVRLHFPSKASDQHLTPTITEEEFCSFPVLSAPFYKYDLALISHNTSPVTIVSSDFSRGKQMALKLKVPLEFGLHIRFTAKLSCDKPEGCSPDIDVFSQPSLEGWDFYIPPVFWELATLDVFLFDERINSSYGEMAMQFAIKFKLRAEDVDNYSAFPMCCNPSKSSSFILISPFACAQALHSTQTFKVRPRVLPTSKYDTDVKLYLMNPRRNASILKFDWAEGVYSITSKLSIAGDWSIDLKVTNEMYYPLFKYIVS